MNKTNSFILALFIFVSNSYGKTYLTDSIDTASVDIKYRTFKMALDYSSENTFKGRRNTTNIPVLTPYFRYTTKQGFFVKASIVDAPTQKKLTKLFDELDAGLGWMFDFSDAWNGSVSYTHYFYNAKVARLKSSVQSDFNLSTGYDWDIVYSQLLFDYNPGNPKLVVNGKKTPKRTQDYSITFANSHDFIFIFNNESKLIISPELDVIWETQNFLAAYKGKLDTAPKKYLQQASAFSFAAYILYLNVTYKIKRFSIAAYPSYTIPQNVPEGESSTPFFVMSGRIAYTIKSK